MPVRLRFSSKRIMPGLDVFFSVTAIGCPMSGEDYRGPMPTTVPSPPSGHPARTVPVRQVLGIIGLVLAAALAVELVIKLQRIITWLAIAGFFAVVLTPPVSFLQRRLRFPRAVATLVVFLLGIAIVAGAI